MLAALTPEEREVVRRAMEATFGFFDFDFHTRLGVSPDEMRFLLQTWSDVNDTSDESDACLAINNSLNDLLYGECISDETARELIGVDRAEMHNVYKKWAAARGWSSTGVR
jgi:hypothetical protein